LKKLQVLKTNHVVQKNNVLNEMRATNMTLQELRFLSIYLAKINKDDAKGTRLVRFELREFQRIMEIERSRIDHLKRVTNSLLCKVVNIQTERGGWHAFQLFKECKIEHDDHGLWYIEIDAHDKALPLMFAFKSKYFNYQLWNALQLASANQLRMYELLKQYETMGERTMTLEDLRKWLGIADKEYPRWESFKTCVLDACQKALAKNTDITYTYEPIRKGIGRGTGRKITHVKFIIQKNENFVNRLSLENFINLQPEVVEPDELDMDNKYETEQLVWIASACNYIFDNAQMKVISNHIRHIKDDFDRYAIIKTCYDKMNIYSEIKHPFQYFQKILQAEIN
jgi:plasmid replication initiation protein